MKPYVSPAISEVSRSTSFVDNRSDFISKVSEKSVLLTLDRIRSKSVILCSLEKSNKIKLVGAMCNLETGKVKILN